MEFIVRLDDLSGPEIAGLLQAHLTTAAVRSTRKKILLERTERQAQHPEVGLVLCNEV